MPTRRQDTPAQQFDTTLKKLFQTLPSRLIEESAFLRTIFLKGEKSGIKIGEKRGILLGASRLLQIQLEGRFGKLPKWALSKLQTADSHTPSKNGERKSSGPTAWKM